MLAELVSPSRARNAATRSRLSDAGKTVLVELLPIVSGGRKTILVPTDRVSGLAFSPAGDVLAVSVGWNGSVIRLYRTDDGREMERFACPALASYPSASSLRLMVAAWRRAWLIRRL